MRFAECVVDRYWTLHHKCMDGSWRAGLSLNVVEMVVEMSGIVIGAESCLGQLEPSLPDTISRKCYFVDNTVAVSCSCRKHITQ